MNTPTNGQDRHPDVSEGDLNRLQENYNRAAAKVSTCEGTQMRAEALAMEARSATDAARTAAGNLRIQLEVATQKFYERRAAALREHEPKPLQRENLDTRPTVAQPWPSPMPAGPIGAAVMRSRPLIDDLARDGVATVADPGYVHTPAGDDRPHPSHNAPAVVDTVTATTTLDLGRISDPLGIRAAAERANLAADHDGLGAHEVRPQSDGPAAAYDAAHEADPDKAEDADLALDGNRPAIATRNPADFEDENPF